MKNTNKLVLGTIIVFTVALIVSISVGGSSIVSTLSSLSAVVLSIAYKYKTERDNIIDALDSMQKSIVCKNLRIEMLEDALTSKFTEADCKYSEPKLDVITEVAKKPRRYKSKVKPELV